MATLINDASQALQHHWEKAGTDSIERTRLATP
jgi:hypothetical protein